MIFGLIFVSLPTINPLQIDTFLTFFTICGWESVQMKLATVIYFHSLQLNGNQSCPHALLADKIFQNSGRKYLSFALFSSLVNSCLLDLKFFNHVKRFFPPSFYGCLMQNGNTTF